MSEPQNKRAWTVMLVIAFLLAIVGVVVWQLRDTLNGSGGGRTAAFQDIESVLSSKTLIGMTESQLVARFGAPGTNEMGDLVFKTGGRFGEPLQGPREDEELVVRVRAGVVVEAGIGRLRSYPGWPR